MAKFAEASLYNCPNCPKWIEITDPALTRSLDCPGCGSTLRVELLDAPGSRFVVNLAPA